MRLTYVGLSVQNLWAFLKRYFTGDTLPLVCLWHEVGRYYYIITLLLPKGCLHNKSRLFRLFVPFSAFQSGRHRIYPFDLFQWFFVIRFSHVNVVDIHHIMLISLFSETSSTFTNLSVTWLQGLTDSSTLLYPRLSVDRRLRLGTGWEPPIRGSEMFERPPRPNLTDLF